MNQHPEPMAYGSGWEPLQRGFVVSAGWKGLYAYSRATDSYVLKRGALRAQPAPQQRPRLTAAQARAELNAIKGRGERQRLRAELNALKRGPGRARLTAARARAELDALKRGRQRQRISAAQARAELNALKRKRDRP